MPDRKILALIISSKSWEHPADRAALNAAARPADVFDEVVRKVMGFFGDVGVRCSSFSRTPCWWAPTSAPA